MSMPREAFTEWQCRFGRAGVSPIEELRRVKAEHGDVGPGDLRRLADRLHWPVAAVTGTASFYADFAGGPRGRRHVRVCDGTACFVATAGRHIERLEAKLGVRRGDRAADGSVSLQAVYCLGFCYTSPAALDGSDPRTGPDLGGLLGHRTHPTIAGPAPPIPYRAATPRPVVMAGLLGEEGPWQVWPRVLATASPEEVLTRVGEAGLRGRGGAEFPATVKWAAAARGPAPRYVVANGDEGDPGSFCDRLLMEQDPHRVLEGLALAGYAVGASTGVVLVRSEYPAALARMRSAVAEAQADGHLGRGVHRSGFDFDVDVVEGAGSYVAGEETALLHLLQGLRGNARSRPPYPAVRGLAGSPTVVNNVETLTAVPWIVRHGGAGYARLGPPGEPGTKLVCLNERFVRPGVYEVEFGAPLRFIVDELGGGLRDGYELRSVQIGGPLGGFLPPDRLDLPLSAAALADVGVALGHGSIVAVDTGVRAADLLAHVWSFAASESCGACVPCRIGTRRGLELATTASIRPSDASAAAPSPATPSPATTPATPSQTAGEAAAALRAQERLAGIMTDGSLCAFGRGVAGSIRSLVRVYRDELGDGGA